MATDDDFCLKWNDHHSAFFSSAERLCRTEMLTDVTLSCGGREFSAHKLVLSVCSGYFAGLFARRQSQQGRLLQQMLPGQTIVYLKDVEARHIELILDYMYRGEINVQENELMGLLATAKGLQVKGLTDASGGGGAAAPTTGKASKHLRAKSSVSAAAATPTKPPKRIAFAISSGETVSKRFKEESNPLAVTVDDNGEELNSAEEMPPRRQRFRQEEVEEEEGYVEEYGGLEDNDEEEQEYENDDNDEEDLGTVKYVDDQTCPVCCKSFSSVAVMRRHHATVHTLERPFACWMCKYTTNRKYSLKEHCMRSHSMDDEEFAAKAKESFKRVKYSEMIGNAKDA